MAWQIRRAVYSWGAWFDARRNETVERPVPERKKPTMRVPKYSEAQLRAMLGLTEGAGGTTELGYRTADGRVWTDKEIEALAMDVLAGDLTDDED